MQLRQRSGLRSGYQRHVLRQHNELRRARLQRVLQPPALSGVGNWGLGLHACVSVLPQIPLHCFTVLDRAGELWERALHRLDIGRMYTAGCDVRCQRCTAAQCLTVLVSYRSKPCPNVIHPDRGGDHRPGCQQPPFPTAQKVFVLVMAADGML